MPAIAKRRLGCKPQPHCRPSDAMPPASRLIRNKGMVPLVVVAGQPVRYTTPSGEVIETVVKRCDSNKIYTTNGRVFNRYGEGMRITARECRLEVCESSAEPVSPVSNASCYCRSERGLNGGTQ